MAYNPYYPYTPGYNQFVNPVVQQPTPQNQNQIQNGGFISARSEDEVLNYPVAPGNCVTFKIEGQPIVMEKAMGFSQLEKPYVKKYRLVEEEVAENTAIEPKQDVVDLSPINSALDGVKGEIAAIWGEIEALKNPPKKPGRKKEVEDDTE
jgi:hypothetical protein